MKLFLEMAECQAVILKKERLDYNIALFFYTWFPVSSLMLEKNISKISVLLTLPHPPSKNPL